MLIRMSGYWMHDDVAFLHARYVTPFTRHTHEEYSVGVILDGAMVFHWNGGEHVAGPTAISAINPGEVHTGEPARETGWEYRNMFIPPSAVSRIAPELGDKPHDINAPIISDWPLARKLFLAHRAAAPGAPPNLAKDVLLAEAIGALFSRHAARRSPASEARPAVRRAQDYLHVHFAEPVRLQVLAELVGLSQFHFIRTFARNTGLTPHAYQDQLRVAHGYRLLMSGVPACEAAAASGYADQSHFIRAFKRCYGVTPGMVARANGWAGKRPRRATVVDA
jgi:AraC-like DNA-binding protein